ncbi:MAG: glycosyltransferase family 2 protein [Syntrophales bacterium]
MDECYMKGMEGRTVRGECPLSVAIIAKNEAKNLSACLESVSFAGQIVVVDSGSADDTLRIAADYGCEIYQEEWRGFGPQKQLAIDRCKLPWVLVLDADERIPEETARVIRELVAGAGQAAGFSFPRRNYFQGRWIRHAGWWPDRVARLFKNGKGQMTGAMVHEAVVVDGLVEQLAVPIDHYTESRLEMIIPKINRYSTLGAEEAFAAGRRTTIFGAFLRAKITFFQDYLFRGGFLDGPQGFTLAVTDSVNKFFKYAKLAEMSREVKGCRKDGGKQT